MRARTHTRIHTQQRSLVAWKKCHTWKKCYSLGQRLKFLANRLVIYKFISLRHYLFFFFWHLCKRQGECIHIKMFTFNGKTTQNGSLSWTHFQVFAHRFFWALYQLFKLVTGGPWEPHISLASNKRNGMTSTFLCFQASTQKPCCSSYIWQVLMLPKLGRVSLATWFSYYEWVSCFKVPLQRHPLNNMDRIKATRGRAHLRPSTCICSVVWQMWSEEQMKALVARQVLRTVSSLVPSWEGCHYWCSCSVWRGKAADEHSPVFPEHSPPSPPWGWPCTPHGSH